MSNRNLPGDKLLLAQGVTLTLPPSVSRWHRKCGKFDASRTNGPPRIVTGKNLVVVIIEENKEI
jgi:hypothetical protein